VGRKLMAKEIQFPTGYKPLDDFMENVVWKRAPKVKLYDKSSSVLMWALYICGFMWIWMNDFFNNSHTTIGKRVYITRTAIEKGWWESIYRVMRHEFVHILQRLKYGLLYDISYLFPQILASGALLALLAIWFSNSWLWALCALGFGAPWPAPWRKKWELEGYTQSMLTRFELYNDISDNYVKNIALNFVTSFYYFMWPFEGYVIKKLNSIKIAIIQGKIKGPFLHYSS
jgi:hypothetical protein